MAKRGRPGKKGKTKGGFSPKSLDRIRDSALTMTEEWISYVGGDRRLADPGPSRMAISRVAAAAWGGEMPSYEDVAAQWASHGHHVSEEDFRFELGTLAVSTHRLVRWVNFGMPVFVLDRDTATMLALTDVDTLDIDDVHLPFPTFLLVLAPGTPLYIDDSGNAKEVRYIWVHSHESPGGEGMSVTITPAVDLERGLSLPIPLRITSGQPVRTWTDPLLRGPQVFGPTMTEVDMATGSAAIRLVVSFAMHLSQAPARRQAPRRGISRPERYAELGLPLPSDWIVQPIQMPSEIRDAVREGGVKITGELTARHVVRGHWRMQAVGPARGQRRPTWIAPHWRGRGSTAVSRVRGGNPEDDQVRPALLDW